MAGQLVRAAPSPADGHLTKSSAASPSPTASSPATAGSDASDPTLLRRARSPPHPLDVVANRELAGAASSASKAMSRRRVRRRGGGLS
ncbi:hypothetical protein GUJ93_ZPchr0001g30393 [Zizania palustris]|uniref:Uncharacterized protein n=1 Tax=Zizania palustris TaxID=103762 RepID=A0A8J5SB90_ZIZPA|nr:hypothetical protein GUJ93_ZPchr0001g30393 [Zizania palustris]